MPLSYVLWRFLISNAGKALELRPPLSISALPSRRTLWYGSFGRFLFPWIASVLELFFFMGEDLLFNIGSAAVVAAEAAIGANDAMTRNLRVEVSAHDHADGACGFGIAGESGDFFVSEGFSGGDLADDFVDGCGEI